MRSRLLLACLVLLPLLTGLAWADTRTISLSANETELTLMEQDRDALRFRIEIGEMAAFDVQTKEGSFTRLLIPGFHTSKTEGAPELPMMNRLIAIPSGATARVVVENSRTRLIDLGEFGITQPLMPAQPSMPKNADPQTWPFVYDRAAYQVSKISPEMVRVVEQGRLRAMNLGRLEISPVQYFPQTNQVEVTESIDLRIVFEGADHAAASDLIAQTYSPFFEQIYARAANDRAFHDDYPDRVNDVVTMVVITPPEFAAQLQDFVSWKTERGFHMVVGVIGTPDVGTTTTSIQTYIHGLYNSPPEGLPAPSFVLFVGDVAQCPTFTMSGDATDRPYCAIDGDLVPDIYYGRFSATNPSQLQAILDKTMMYDQFTMPDPSYLEEVVMIAGMDAGHGSTWGNGQINYGTDYYFNAAHGIFSHTYLYPESGSNAANIVQNVSDGVGYINYTAHGSQTSWADPTFTQANINGLANDGEYCLAVGNCCLTSTYDYGECFGETFLRAPNKGAIGYIGGSNSTYWDEDYWWGVGHTASIVANPTYEGSGIGAYDGLFHDHGEGDHLWYVTNDALIFSGNLAVMEAGSSLTTYYWNIYNLLGDPSLSTYLGVPAANPVSHPETVFNNWTNLTVSAEYGSYVGLTQDGVLVGAGTVGDAGSLDIEFLQTPLTPGIPLHMVVMAQNREPYIADLNVIVPATILINPVVIDANVPTDITVTVLDAEGVNPQPGINVWAEGLGYATTPVMTNGSGVAVISVNYPYGPSLDIVGQDPAESYRLFTEPITVNALTLSSPDLSVSTDIGLSDAFALNLPGTLHATVAEPGHLLYAILPDGSDLNTAAYDLELTPAELGQVTGIIAVSGYDIYSEAFDIIEAYGTLTGTVTSGGSSLAEVTVNGYNTADDLVFSAVTDGAGNYDVGEDILVADYTIVVDHFGYLHYEDPIFINYGANVYDIDLTPAPSGVIFGTVTSSEGGAPLQATVKVYRMDTMELYTETTSDPADGSYATASLPYFDYRVTVKAWHYIPVTIEVTVEDPLVEKHFILDPTIGDLLVIDDSAKSGMAPAKFADDGTYLGPGYEAGSAKAAADLMTDLEDLGYTATLEDAAATDPLLWENYDLVIVSSGNNTATLNQPGLMDALVAFVGAGGHLLVEGGEVAYDHQTGPFAETVLHIMDWTHDSSGDLTVADPAHFVMTVPNTITGPIAMTYVGYGDEDAVIPAPDAAMVGSWTTYPTDASIVTYDPNPAPEGGQIVFFAFNYSAMDAVARPELLQNTVTWLMTPEFGTSSVSGVATLQGEADHSGIRIDAIPNGGYVTTGPDGSFTLPGLFAGTYEIVASKDGWRSDSVEVTLAEGQNLTGLELMLGAPGSVSGTAILPEGTDHSGIRVSATPGGVFVITGTSGAYTLEGLLAGSYTITASKLGYVPDTAIVTLSDGEVVTGVDLVLGTAEGNLLVIDDGGAKVERPAKISEKGQMLAEGYTQEPAKAALDIAEDLEFMGYSVILEDVSVTDPASWSAYDLVVYSCGDNLTTVSDAAILSGLVDYVNTGGKLLIEGGEIGFDHQTGPLATDVLHISDWSSDIAGDLAIADDTHYVVNVPNNVPDTLGLVYSGYGDSDAMDVAADAQLVMEWTSYPAHGSVICYDPTPSPEGGQIVYFAFNYSAVGTPCTTLLENAVLWLLREESPGTAGISGTVSLEGESDYSGVTVTATPGGATAVTGPDGIYSLTDLYPGAYTVTAVKEGWSVGVAEVTLTEGQQLTGVDFVLGVVYIAQECSLPGLAIPDSDPAGVSDTLIMPDLGMISGVEVYVDITHTWIGDLLVNLSSPDGTTVTLHNRSGSSADNIVGWYPSDLEPAGSLDDFLGEAMGGEWTLFVSDNVGCNTGTLNEWCVKVFYYAGDVTAVGEELPRTLALRGNYPNPFNPLTKINYDLPRTTQVELAIYDLSGRLVATLVDEQVPAGRHEAVWAGRDDAGRGVASGNYFYRLIADGHTFTRKMMLLK